MSDSQISAVPRRVLSREAEEYVDRFVAAADPMDAETIADMRLIIWGPEAIRPGVMTPACAQPDAA